MWNAVWQKKKITGCLCGGFVAHHICRFKKKNVPRYPECKACVRFVFSPQDQWMYHHLLVTSLQQQRYRILFALPKSRTHSILFQNRAKKCKIPVRSCEQWWYNPNDKFFFTLVNVQSKHVYVNQWDISMRIHAVALSLCPVYPRKKWNIR